MGFYSVRVFDAKNREIYRSEVDESLVRKNGPTHWRRIKFVMEEARGGLDADENPELEERLNRDGAD